MGFDVIQYVLGRGKHVSKQYGNMRNSPFGRGNKETKTCLGSSENINNKRSPKERGVNEQSFGDSR